MKPVLKPLFAIGFCVSMQPAFGQISTEAPTDSAAPPAGNLAPALSPSSETDASPAQDQAQSSAEVGAAPEKKAASANGGSRAIEEIVVTATKRSENLQEVPIAISAFSGEKLDALGVESATELSKLTPGLTFSTSAGYPQIYLRGVGSDAFLPSADPTVPIYLDGVAQLSGHGVQDTLGRVARVEVVKGPQGTLFGRNSTGGAISITTPDPEADFSGDVSQSFGNLGTLNTQFYLNLPIIKGLGATLAGYNEQHDTYVQNIDGPTVATYSRGVRLKLVWQALDNLSFNFAGSYSEDSGNVGTGSFENTRVAPDFAAILPAHGPLSYKNTDDFTPATVLYDVTANAGFDWKLPWAELKLITSNQHEVDNYVAYDYDGTAVSLLSFDSTDEFFNQATAELQILSTPDTPFAKEFSWVAGAYYLEGNGGFPDLVLHVAGGALSIEPGLAGFANSVNGLLSAAGVGQIPVVNGPVNAVSGGLLASRSLSGYFQGTTYLSDIFNWSQQVNLITGARLDRESRALDDNRLAIVDPGASSENSNGTQTTIMNFVVPKISAVQVPLKFELQWFPVDDAQIYASFSRGFTSPTYSTVNFFQAPPALQPEKVNSYEIGTKLKLFNGTMTLNSAAFYIKETNALTGFAGLTSGGVVEFENVPAARIRGVEGDMTWSVLPTLDPGLALLASASYLDGKYTKYPNGRGYDTTTGLAFGPSSDVFGVPVTTLPARDFTGHQITRTPHLTYNIGLNQSVPLGDNGRLEMNVSTNYSSQFFFDSQNAVLNESPSFQLLDASASYFYTPWGVQITGYGLNLTKTLYPSSVFLLDTGRFQSPNDPRTFGLRLKYTF